MLCRRFNSFFYTLITENVIMIVLKICMKMFKTFYVNEKVFLLLVT